MSNILISIRLACKDLFHERLMSFCSIMALASILAPLLILFGVRYGVMTTLHNRLIQDPNIVTIIPLGSGQGYTKAWLQEVRQWPEVRFAILRTRDIAATIQVRNLNIENGKFLRVSLEPTGMGDPTIEQAQIPNPQGLSVIISDSVARKLHLKLNDTLQGNLGRTRPSGGVEYVDLQLIVGGILPLAAEDRDLLFVPMPLLDAAEYYRDYIAVPDYNFTGDHMDDVAKESRRYAGFRIIANDLNDVSILRERLQAQRIEVITKSREIEFVQDLNTSLNLIFMFIAITASLGFVTSTTSTIIASVRRKDKILGTLRLIGLSKLSIMAYPITQALATSVCGMILASFVYVFVAFGIDSLFSANLYGAAVCKMELWHFVIAFIIVIMLSCLASLRAAVLASRIEPADVLRTL